MPDIQSILPLSISRLTTFLICPAQFDFKYVRGIKTPATDALVRGVVVHSAVEEMYLAKQKNGTLPSIGDITPSITEEFAKQKQGANLSDEQKVFDDIMVSAKTYLDQLAPTIEPSVVEWATDFQIDGIPFTGRLDIVDKDLVIRDTKTSAKMPSDYVMEKDIQLTAYSIAFQQATGLTPKKVCRDYITTGKTPRVETYYAEKKPKDVDRLKKITHSLLGSVEHNLLYPNHQSMMCTPRACSYWDLCHKEW